MSLAWSWMLTSIIVDQILSSRYMKIRIIASSVLIVFTLFIQSCGSKTDKNVFEWDYSKQEKIVYSFTQDVHKKEDAKGDTILTQVHGDAELHVEVQNDSVADVKLSKLVIRAIMTAPNSEHADSMENKPPDLVIHGMKKNGVFTDENTHTLYRVLFPLPKGPLKKGEKYRNEIRIPVRVNQSQLYCKGYIEVTNRGETDYEGTTCAVLYGEFKLDALELPDGTVDQFSYDNYGNGTYYFDQVNGRFLAADIRSFSYIGYEADLEAANYVYNVQESESSYHYRLKEASFQ